MKPAKKLAPVELTHARLLLLAQPSLRAEFREVLKELGTIHTCIDVEEVRMPNAEAVRIQLRVAEIEQAILEAIKSGHVDPAWLHGCTNELRYLALDVVEHAPKDR